MRSNKTGLKSQWFLVVRPSYNTRFCLGLIVCCFNRRPFFLKYQTGFDGSLKRDNQILDTGTMH